MDSKEIMYFRKVCEEGSITKAAQKIYMSPQALSQMIRKLEKELGVELFTRNFSGMTLTDSGKIFFEHSTTLINELNSLKECLREKKEIEELTVGCAFGIVSALTPDYLYSFENKNPYVKLKIMENMDEYIDNMVDREEVEIGLAILPVDRSKFNVEKIGSIPHCLLVNQKHRLYDNVDVSIKELGNERITIENPSFKVYGKFMHLCANYGIVPNIYFTSTEISVAHALASQNKCLSVSVMTEYERMKTANVSAKRFREEFLWEWCVITKKGHATTEAEKKFAEHIKTGWNAMSVSK